MDDSDDASSPSGDEYEVDKILECQIEDGKKVYRVTWKGYPDEITWVPEKDMHCSDAIAEFEKSESIYVVESILDKRETKTGTEYYVCWKGFPKSQASWEPRQNLFCDSKLTKFEAEYARKHKQPTKRRQSQSRRASGKGDDFPLAASSPSAPVPTPRKRRASRASSTWLKTTKRSRGRGRPRKQATLPQEPAPTVTQIVVDGPNGAHMFPVADDATFRALFAPKRIQAYLVRKYQGTMTAPASEAEEDPEEGGTDAEIEILESEAKAEEEEVDLVEEDEEDEGEEGEDAIEGAPHAGASGDTPSESTPTGAAAPEMDVEGAEPSASASAEEPAKPKDASSKKDPSVVQSGRRFIINPDGQVYTSTSPATSRWVITGAIRYDPDEVTKIGVKEVYAGVVPTDAWQDEAGKQVWFITDLRLSQKDPKEMVPRVWRGSYKLEFP
eukprot:gnl/Trimastix_PCT/1668.p1 GENE.gnl/Trimastix_PCT/1668~~gnl/Trimastix_PCT/1668.p1  ORF type:complete len:459 (-),score=115.80 gnl/Trimastix_PCT/1668:63-1388(-)